jgi:ELWxxDGT repeat protein
VQYRCVVGRGLAAAVVLGVVGVLGTALSSSSSPGALAEDDSVCRDRSGAGQGLAGPVKGSGAMNLTVVGDRIFFAGCDRRHGWELWRSDGSRWRTRKVKDIQPGARISPPAELTAAAEALYFTADDGVHGTELWRSDGTRRGTRLVADIAAGSIPSDPHDLFWSPSLGRVLFVADDAVHGQQLWSSDGTAAGTAVVTDLDASGFRGQPRNLRVLDRGDAILFTLTPGPRLPPLLYALVDGAVRVVTASDGHGAVEAWLLVQFGTDVVFWGGTGGTDRGLWRAGDLDAGATRLDLQPGWPEWPDGSISSLTVLDDQLYFMARDPGDPEDPETYPLPRELWKSDGTAAGTVRLSDISHGDFRAYDLAVAGDTIFFHGGVGDRYKEGLWVSDGTAVGTTRIKDVGIACKILPALLVPVGNRVFFVGGDAEPWVSDGTGDGTRRVLDVRPGEDDRSKPRDLAAFGNRLAFTAIDEKHGRELWISDGTAAGTYLVKDIFRRRK